MPGIFRSRIARSTGAAFDSHVSQIGLWIGVGKKKLQAFAKQSVVVRE